MLLAGCAEVENYNNVVKTPAPDWLTGYWQTKGRNVRWSVRKR